MAGDLKHRQMVIFEMVVEMGFGQDGKKPDQGNAAQEECRWDGHRNCAGMHIDQQNGRTKRITSDLRRQRMPAMRGAARQRRRRRRFGAHAFQFVRNWIQERRRSGAHDLANGGNKPEKSNGQSL